MSVLEDPQTNNMDVFVTPTILFDVEVHEPLGDLPNGDSESGYAASVVTTHAYWSHGAPTLRLHVVSHVVALSTDRYLRQLLIVPVEEPYLDRVLPFGWKDKALGLGAGEAVRRVHRLPENSPPADEMVPIEHVWLIRAHDRRGTTPEQIETMVREAFEPLAETVRSAPTPIQGNAALWAHGLYTSQWQRAQVPPRSSADDAEVGPEPEAEPQYERDFDPEFDQEADPAASSTPQPHRHSDHMRPTVLDRLVEEIRRSADPSV